MNKAKLVPALLAVILVALFATVASPQVAWAQEEIRLSTPYPDITLAKEQSIDLPVNVANVGKAPQYIRVDITTTPKGWEASLVNQDYGIPFGVRGLLVTPGEDKAQTIYFRTRVPSEAGTGDYVFVLQASRDGQLLTSLKLTIRVEEKAVAAGGAKLSTVYPVLRGPSGSNFEFNVDLANQGREDRSFGLSAVAPPQWEVSFRPAYESKQISTIRLQAGETKGLDVEIKPPEKVEAGDYVVRVEARSGNIREAIDLAVIITGRYELTMGTPDGRLNAEATAGQESIISIWVSNKGSAPLQNITFLSAAPEGWSVEFKPDRLATLAPGEIREITVAIKPAGRAIAGDYSVSLAARGDQASSNMGLRVAVGTATAWGWVGLAIVLAIIAGMVSMFLRLGRR